MKQTRGELRARVELLAKKKRSVKRRAQDPPEGSLPTRGKVSNLGIYDSARVPKLRGRSGPLRPRCPW